MGWIVEYPAQIMVWIDDFIPFWPSHFLHCEVAKRCPALEIIPSWKYIGLLYAKEIDRAVISSFPSKMISSIFSIMALAAPVVFGLTPLQTFYPPNLNDTSYITNSSLGTYGGVYQAPTRDPNTSAPYGSYDYCTMPHPRAQEYQLPEAVKSGSVKANLVYLEYLQRHQRRTPYNILPGGEVIRLFDPIT